MLLPKLYRNTGTLPNHSWLSRIVVKVQGGSNMTGTICVCKYVTVCPGHIWTTLYKVIFIKHLCFTILHAATKNKIKENFDFIYFTLNGRTHYNSMLLNLPYSSLIFSHRIYEKWNKISADILKQRIDTHSHAVSNTM